MQVFEQKLKEYLGASFKHRGDLLNCIFPEHSKISPAFFNAEARPHTASQKALEIKRFRKLHAEWCYEGPSPTMIWKEGSKTLGVPKINFAGGQQGIKHMIPNFVIILPCSHSSPRCIVVFSTQRHSSRPNSRDPTPQSAPLAANKWKPAASKRF